ncbi:unnamed protein product [Anisakis simplex]|uniref:F-box domain-containing protein n=1 Tax=Anisakis simplex TaxID=6269 RepID=A0A0M3JZ80_ANISI|nr:unnamed protein product [Anisakis simplex]
MSLLPEPMTRHLLNYVLKEFPVRDCERLRKVSTLWNSILRKGPLGQFHISTLIITEEAAQFSAFEQCDRSLSFALKYTHEVDEQCSDRLPHESLISFIDHITKIDKLQLNFENAHHLGAPTRFLKYRAALWSVDDVFVCLGDKLDEVRSDDVENCFDEICELAVFINERASDLLLTLPFTMLRDDFVQLVRQCYGRSITAQFHVFKCSDVSSLVCDIDKWLPMCILDALRKFRVIRLLIDCDLCRVESIEQLDKLAAIYGKRIDEVYGRMTLPNSTLSLLLHGSEKFCGRYASTSLNYRSGIGRRLNIDVKCTHSFF